MPAYVFGTAGPGPAPNTWRSNDNRQQPSTAPTRPTLQPPTGPRDRSAPFQPPSAITTPSAMITNTTSVSTPPSSTEFLSPVPIPTLIHVPYLTSIQLETLYTRRRGARMSSSSWLTNRDIATGFIQSVASRLGFPQTTIATAQQVYQRFHLFYPPTDFVLHEIAVASLFVAAKLCDTHKKPRDLLLASYALRFPQLVKGGSSSPVPDALPSASASASASAEPATFPTLAGQKRKFASTLAEPGLSSLRPLAMAIGSVSESDIDPNILDTDRKRLMALEKFILESLCFNFHSKANAAFKMVIKVGRKCGLDKSLIRSAWKVCADMFRGTGPMQYSPNVIAVASLYAAALLARPPPCSVPCQREGGSPTGRKDAPSDAITQFLGRIKSVSTSPAPSSGDNAAAKQATSISIPLSEPFPACDVELHVRVEDVEEAIHELLDLYLSYTATLPPSLYMASCSSLSVNRGPSGTPSPLSPADPLDAYAASPSSSGSDAVNSQPSTKRKLKQYEYSPPPFGLVEWLNCARCLQLQNSSTSVDHGSRRMAMAAGGTSQTGNSDPTAPIKQLSALLTNLKIYLRGLEYDRQRADDAYLAQLDMIAQVNVIPLVGPTAAAAAAGGMGVGSTDLQIMTGSAGGPVAHSVEILLKPISNPEVQPNASANTGRGVTNTDKTTVDVNKLEKSQKVVVERIKRRKLVAALRMTFVEPEVELRIDTSPEAVQKRQSHVKRRRIEMAKRYIF
uniref:Cyclin-like protein n=1 Tax=Melanopsichium pennsylvanicum 4 TaxID=1398559 RepID=A0A077R7G0_9BASI|nr:cyclin-like protein [Melanopsichium pennsylvanicum 4]